MADRTTSTIYKTRPNSGRDAHPIANGVTIGAGALVQLQNGYLNHWDGTGDFLGVMIGGQDRAGDGVFTGNTSDTPPPEGFVDTSGVVLEHMDVAGTPTQAKVGDAVYCADSDPANLTLTSTGTDPVGRLVRFRGTDDVDVQLVRGSTSQTASIVSGVGSTANIGFITQTVNYDDFTDGGSTSGTLTMTDSVPENAIILATKVLVNAGFTGDTSAVLTIGDGSDVDRYMTGTPSVFTTAETGIQTGVPSGNKLLTSANQPVLTVTSNADFTSVSAGTLVVTIYYIAPPA